MTAPTWLSRQLASTIKGALTDAGNPFQLTPGAQFVRPIVLTVVQRKQLVAGLAALEGPLAAPEAEQLLADELAILCHKLTNVEASDRG